MKIKVSYLSNITNSKLMKNFATVFNVSLACFTKKSGCFSHFCSNCVLLLNCVIDMFYQRNKIIYGKAIYSNPLYYTLCLSGVQYIWHTLFLNL